MPNVNMEGRVIALDVQKLYHYTNLCDILQLLDTARYD